MAGVDIGEVEKVQLKDSHAEVIMSISKNVKLEDDSIAAIKTMGIIGEKYMIDHTGGLGQLTFKTAESYGKHSLRWISKSMISKFVFGSMESKKPSE